MKQNVDSFAEATGCFWASKNGQTAGESRPGKESVAKGELFYLWHPGTEEIFSGYGLAMWPGDKTLLAGLLMVDRPQTADPLWLNEVEATFGDYQLVAMTAGGERGIVCRMQIEPASQPFLRRFPGEQAAVMKAVLQPLLVKPPNPLFSMNWDEEGRVWRSRFASVMELPAEIHQVLAKAGYGCLAVETNIGVVHICHAADSDIAGFAGKPVWSRWQLIKMPTAPLIRLELVIIDQPDNPFKFESFLNVAESDQSAILAQLAGQEHLYLAFYGDDLTYRFTKVIRHDTRQWQQLDELAAEAYRYWQEIPMTQWDFDWAKAMFMQRYS